MARTVELLAPAGSLDTLYAAVNAGADAVYCGGGRFGARAYAKNFDTEELIRGIEYCHLNKAKLYLTVNTLLKNRELGELCEYIRPMYEAGLDAVLVQDIAVFSTLKSEFPKLELHASTQMSIADRFGAGLLKELGFSRVVTARELSLSEIKNIHDNVDIELECFVHGALCYSYSGMCLMSSMLGGRSGNRGRCAGTCRLPFRDACDKKRAEIYPFSLKDICTIDFLPEMIEAGVSSLKIEGRMKTAAYAAGVTSIYRKYLDMYCERGSGEYEVSEEDMKALYDLGNRSGFTDGFYHRHNGADMVTITSPAHTHAPDPELEERYSSFFEKKRIEIEGSFILKRDMPMQLSVACPGHLVSEISEAPSAAENRPVDREHILDKLSKTGDTPFEFKEINIDMDEGLFIPMQWVNELRRRTLDRLKDELLAACSR